MEVRKKTPKNAASDDFGSNSNGAAFCLPHQLVGLSSYLAGSKGVSAVRPPARPSVRPGYDDKYRSKSYRFVERQKPTFFLSAVELFAAFLENQPTFEKL